jgi:multidrug efflux pump subunit AcrA (membrane-fusion protein)
MGPLIPARTPPRRLVVLPALLLGLAAGCSRPTPAEEEKAPPATVKWQGASSNALEEMTELVGTTVPLPDRVARISAPVEGRVVSVLTGSPGNPVVEGQRVDKGTVLVQLDTTVIKANLAKLRATQDVAQEDQRQAQLAIKLATIEVDRLRKLKDEDTKGGGRSPLVSPILLEKAELALEDAQSKLKGAVARLNAGAREIDALQEQVRLHTLAAPIAGRLGRLQVVPGQAISVGTPVADVIDVRDQIDVLCFVPSSMLGRLKVGFKLSDRSLESLRAAQVPEAVLAKLQALKDKQEKELEEGTFRTPDQFIQELTAALTADELDHYRNLVLNHARAGQPARTVAEPDASGTAGVEAEGQVEYIAEQAEPETGNFAVKVRFSNAEAHLRANRVIRFRVETKPTRECLSIPETALQESEEPPTVVVVDQIKIVKDKDTGKEDTVGVAHRVEVVLGVRNKGQVEIVSLNDPEKNEKKKWTGTVKDAQFVVEGGQGLQSDDKVKLDVETD